MTSRIHMPAGPLGAFVRCIWYSEGSPQAHEKERLLPTGEASIIFNLREPEIRIYDSTGETLRDLHSPAIFSGARANGMVIETSAQDRVAGIQFRAGGAFPFLRAPAGEFEESAVNLCDVWRAGSGELTGELRAASDPGEVFGILERRLAKEATLPLAHHAAVECALREFERGEQVDAVRERIGLSPRRFIELFRREVGLTPKVFCRVRRFQGVLNTVHRKRDVDWARVAVDCGYYDQAHFIHDFRAFSGLTPGAYAEAATPNLNHVKAG